MCKCCILMTVSNNGGIYYHWKISELGKAKQIHLWAGWPTEIDPGQSENCQWGWLEIPKALIEVCCESWSVVECSWGMRIVERWLPVKVCGTYKCWCRCGCDNRWSSKFCTFQPVLSLFKVYTLYRYGNRILQLIVTGVIWHAWRFLWLSQC